MISASFSKLKINTRFKSWHTGAFQLVSFVLAMLTLVLLNYRPDLWPWFTAWAICHFIGTGTGSMGSHELFSHGTWNPPMWAAKTFAWITHLLGIGGGGGWEAGHQKHHKHFDTPLDPHNAGSWKGFFLGRYFIHEGYDRKGMRRLLKRYPWMAKMNRKGWLIPLQYSLMLLGADVACWLNQIETYFFLFFYAAPLFTALTSGAIHNVLSHNFGEGPRDMPEMFDYPLIFAGSCCLMAALLQQTWPLNGLVLWLLFWQAFEWPHGSHHDEPGKANMAFRYKYRPALGFPIMKLLDKNLR